MLELAIPRDLAVSADEWRNSCASLQRTLIALGTKRHFAATQQESGMHLGIVSERVRRPVKQLKLGRQRRDAQVRLGASEIRLECLQLVGGFR